MTVNKPIFLCGFMGCGKSAVGKALAEVTAKRYIDLDIFIEERENRTIGQIFEVRGEDYFRKVESQCLTDVSAMTNVIVALGGGSLHNQERIDNIKKNGKLIFINTPLNLIKERLKRSNKRPLLKNEDGSRMEDSILDDYVDYLYKKRVSLYQKADIIYEPINGSAKDQALRIKELLLTYE